MVEDVSHPGKIEWYLIQLAAEVRLLRGVKKVDLNDPSLKVTLVKKDAERGDSPGAWPITTAERQARIKGTYLVKLPVEERRRIIDQLRQEREAQAKVKEQEENQRAQR